ncbi:MAG: BMP family ABC transporter substrate-binding protein [Spirochaetales bacterium]|jgi:basic membrane protein A|nr:BMP family ABC transporter substrate-binding protein [Spirochaetales bacterium]
MKKTTTGKTQKVLLLSVLAAILSLTHCGREQPWKPGQPLAKEKIKIGVIHPNETTEVSEYDYAHYMGTVHMQRDLELWEDQIIRKINVFDADAVAAENAMRDCIAEGANIILAPSWGYMDTCEKLSVQYPSVVFAHGLGHKYNSANFTNFSGRAYQARYLSGIVAGMKTRTNKLGYVAAMGKDSSEVSAGLNAFALGVESVNPAARVHVKVTYSWIDRMGETEAANALIARGCDVITAHVNTPSAQIAAQKAGVWAIGFNTDMRKDAPRAVITSVVLNWGVYYTYLVRSVMNGSFTTRPYFGGIAEAMVSITPLSEELAPPGAKEAVEAVRQRMMSGEFNVFDGELKTNDGQTVGTEGATLPDSEIIGGIHWYYRNVVES